MTRRWEPEHTRWSVTSSKGEDFCDGNLWGKKQEAKEVAARWNKWNPPHEDAPFKAKEVTISGGWVHDLGSIKL